MKQISEEVIEKSVAFINSASDEVLNQKSEQYADSYETLVAYVFQSAAEDDDDDLMGYLVYYYTLIMNVFETAGFEIPQISDEAIDEFHETYLEMIEEFKDDEDYAELSNFIGQPVLMSFLIQDISMEDDEGIAIDEELQSMLNMILIGLVGVLTKNVK